MVVKQPKIEVKMYTAHVKAYRHSIEKTFENLELAIRWLRRQSADDVYMRFIMDDKNNVHEMWR